MYITLDDTKNYLGIELTNTDYDTRLNMYIEESETLINDTLRVLTLNNRDYNSNYKYEGNGHYILRHVKPNSILEINGNVVDADDYILSGRKLQLINFNDTSDDIHGKILIKYNAGYSTIPNIVKYVSYEIVEILFSNYKSGKIEGTNFENVKNFKQGDLSVAFNTGDINQATNSNTTYKNIKSLIQNKLSKFVKYSKIKIYSN